MEIELDAKTKQDFAEALEGVKRVTEAYAEQIAQVAPVVMAAAVCAKAMSNVLALATDTAKLEGLK